MDTVGRRTISYTMAPPESYYEDHVLRKVTQVLAGVTVTLSETTTGLTYDEFTKNYPNEPVDGRSAGNLKLDLQRMSDEDLAELGLTRQEGVERQVKEPAPPEVLEPSYNYPVHEGFGWYRLSDDTKAKGKAVAHAAQAELDVIAEEANDQDEEEFLAEQE